MAKRIKDEDLSVIAEALSPTQYRKLKRLMEGRLMNIARNVKRSLDKRFDDADSAINPSYLSDEDMGELTQEMIDKCRNAARKTRDGFKTVGKRAKQGARNIARRTKKFLNDEYDKINNAPNPMYWDDEDDDTLF